jgi:hypothetical protein
MTQPTHLDLDALQAAADEFHEFLNEPLGDEKNLTVREYRSSVYQKWIKIDQGISAMLDRLRKAEAARDGRLAGQAQKCLPHGLRYQMPPLELTGHQVMLLAAMAQDADSLDAVWQIKELEPKSALHDGEACHGGIAAITDGQPGWALLNAAPASTPTDSADSEGAKG